MKLVVANWKCNPTSLEQAKQLFDSVERGIGDIKNVEVVICPPFVWLPILRKGSTSAKGYGGLAFGSQNCFWKQKGAFTGEVSARMLKNLGCEYVILGHFERRQYLGETDEMIAKKLKASLEAELKPILCIGESEQEKKSGETENILKQQLTTALKNVSSFKFQVPSLYIAYEPVWAIGTGNACNPDDAKTVLSFLKEKIDEVIPRQIPVIYGGSVDSNNAKDYIDVGFDGLLVGGVSLNAEEFVKIVRTLEKK